MFPNSCSWAPTRCRNRGQAPAAPDFQSGRILYGAVTIDQRITPAVAKRDYMTAWDEWLAIQNGAKPASSDTFGSARFITTPRDLATYVHYDALYEAYLILLEMGAKPDSDLPPWASHAARKASACSARPTC